MDCNKIYASGIADPDTLVVDSETGDVIERRIGTKMIRF